MSTSLALRSLHRVSLGRIQALRSFHTSFRRAEKYVNPNREAFDKLISADSRVVLVDFYADWCGPCHQLSPILDKLTAAPNKSGSGNSLDLVKIDVDNQEQAPLAQKYKVRAMPTVIAFRNGEMINSFVGAHPQPYIEEFLSQL